MNFQQALAEAKKDAIPPPQPQEHFLVGGVYIRELHLEAGYTVVQHRHAYDHISILAQGTVILSTSDGDKKIISPAAIPIKAHTDHAIYAVTPAIWYCIHASDQSDPDTIDEVLICRGDCAGCKGVK